MSELRGAVDRMKKVWKAGKGNGLIARILDMEKPFGRR